MVRACLLLLAGSVIAQLSRVPISADLCKLTLVAALAACASRRTRAPGLLLLGFSLFMQAGLAVIDARLDPRYAGDSMLAQVRVVDFPAVSGAATVLTVTPLADARLPARSRISWFDAPVEILPGDVWELEVRLRRPRGHSNPGGFDVEAWMFRERLYAAGYVVDGPRNRLLWSGAPGRVDDWRWRFVRRARAAADSDAAAAVLAAVGVGARHLVGTDQWERYAATGTTHLMAISGLHVGLAAMAAFCVAFAAAGPFAGSRCHRGGALIAGSMAAVAYAVLAGFGVPARRAALMLALAAVAITRRRQPDIAAIPALAAIAVFVTDPLATLAPGYNLSFGAVLLLLWLAQRRTARRAGPVALVRMQVFLLVGLLPFTALYFQRFAPLALPANLVAVPLFSFVTVPLTLAGMVTGSVNEQVGNVLLRWAAASVDGLERLLAALCHWPLADLAVAATSGPACLLLLFPLAWVLLPPGWPVRRAGLLGVLVILTWKPATPPAGCFDAWVLDAGQGLAAVVQTRNRTLVYDTGVAYRGGGSAADRVLLPFLRARGTERVDRLVVSHADLDHAGGIAALRRRMPVREILLGEPISATSASACHAGRAWHDDGVAFRVLHPEVGSGASGNTASCVVRVAAGDRALLLTGDIEAPVERQLVMRHAPLDADVVVVPHHGSTTSSSTPFVAAVSPQFAIVSAGRDNRWGFPDRRVTQRWQQAGATVLNTATDGAVELRICAGKGLVKIRSSRVERRRFWHDET